MGPIEALGLALAKEIESINLYEDFSSKYPAAKEIFLFLVGEEEKHKQLIESKLVELSQ